MSCSGKGGLLPPSFPFCATLSGQSVIWGVDVSSAAADFSTMGSSPGWSPFFLHYTGVSIVASNILSTIL